MKDKLKLINCISKTITPKDSEAVIDALQLINLISSDTQDSLDTEIKDLIQDYITKNLKRVKKEKNSIINLDQQLFYTINENYYKHKK